MLAGRCIQEYFPHLAQIDSSASFRVVIFHHVTSSHVYNCLGDFGRNHPSRMWSCGSISSQQKGQANTLGSETAQPAL